MIIGLTGRIASGKGEIAEFLKEKGFEYYTISQAVREEASKIKIPITRESLQDVGDLIRKYEGTSGWIKRIIQKINLSKNQIIDGIRNPGEIEELKKYCLQDVRLTKDLYDIYRRDRRLFVPDGKDGEMLTVDFKNKYASASLLF